MKDNQQKLFSEFTSATNEQWEEQIKKELKGADYKRELSWQTLEGITPLPFYSRNDLKGIPAEPTIRSTSTVWQRCETVFETDPADINTYIQRAIKGGANSIQINCDITSGDQMLGGNMTGAQIQSQNDFNKLFEGVDLKSCSLVFESQTASPALLAMLLNHSDTFKSASFLFDPFTYHAKHGRKPLPSEKLPALISQMQGRPNIRCLAADGLFYHRAGCTIVQEVAIVLAIASEYLMSVDETTRLGAARSFIARLSAGPLYFPEIAKFRAIRRLWRNLLGAYGVKEEIPLYIHAETSPQNKTVTDSHNNTLRATTEAMSAVLGGVDSLSIAPYDAGYQKPNDFSLRIARNIHHIVRDEAHLNKAADPSAGSYYIEQLTDQIAQESWEFFQLIEKQGGFVKALENRILQSEVNESKKRKLEAYSTRKRVLTGTNNYPNPDEELPNSFKRSIFTDALIYTDSEHSPHVESLIPSLREHLSNGGTVGDISKSILEPQKVLFTTLEEFNAGELFDLLRSKTNSITKKLGRKPRVSLIPVGDAKWRKLRATFAQNLLGCAGFDIENHAGFEMINEAVNDINPDKSDLFVLCGSDKEYEKFVHPFCEAFVKKGILILAGSPGDREKAYQDWGIDEFIMKGMDVPEFLGRLQQKLTEEAL
jgi:methylmalonyl-CoA mutase